MRYKSGSYSDMRGYNLALGFAKAIQNNAGKLTYGPLLEYGWAITPVSLTAASALR